MRYRVLNTVLLLSICFFVSACDQSKKSYEEVKTLFDNGDYSAAKNKADRSNYYAKPSGSYYVDARELYEKIEKIEASLEVARKATQAGDLENAIKAYEEILTLDNRCREAIAELPTLKEKNERKSRLLQDAKAFEETGEWEKAIEAYKTILTFIPFNKDASSSIKYIEEYDYPSCCREEINKYMPHRQLLGSIDLTYSQEASGDNEFELKKNEERIKKEKDEISRKTVFFDIIDLISGNVRLSEYDFRKQEYKVRFGVQRGSSGGERFGIASTPDVLKIANDKGNRMEFTLKMKEKEAESLDKENLKLFVVYKFIKGERFKYWSPLTAQVMQGWGDGGYEKATRIYIKPINVTLLNGDSKYGVFPEVLAVDSLKDNGNGTVTDSKTHFMWQQGEGGALNWDTAIAYCNNLPLAGYNDWRLPNKDELKSIIDRNAPYLKIDTTKFPNAASAVYWSSTAYPVHESAVWGVIFYNGNLSSFDKRDSRYVRCVRSSK